MSTTRTPLPPAQDLAAFLRRFPREMTFSDEDPAAVVDRYHTPDFVQYNDGVAINRDALVGHARPVRKNVVSLDIDVQETVVAPERGAARYTLRAQMRKGEVVHTEIYMFARFASDGRLLRIDQITRDLPEESTAEDTARSAASGAPAV